MEISQKEIDKLGEEKIKIGKDLIQKLNNSKHIQGVGKVKKKLSAEVSTLQNVCACDKLKLLIEKNITNITTITLSLFFSIYRQ